MGIFDACGTLSGEPPGGQAGEIEIEVISRDGEGRESRTWFNTLVEAIRATAVAQSPHAGHGTGLAVDERRPRRAGPQPPAQRQRQRRQGEERRWPGAQQGAAVQEQ